MGGLVGGGGKDGGGSPDMGQMAAAYREGIQSNEKLTREMMRRADAIKLPSKSSMQIVMREMMSQGSFTPEMLDVVLMNPTAFLDIAEQQDVIDSQRDALGKMEEIAAEGGLDDVARAGLFKVRTEANAMAKGKRDAMRNEALATGTYGSGQDLALRAMADQGAVGMAAQRGFDEMAMGQQRKDQALRDQAQLATNIRGQELSKEEKIAAAIDNIAKFNAANKQQIMRENVGAVNQAEMLNLGEAQRIADANVSLQNQAEASNKAIPERKFGMELSKVGLGNQALGQQAATNAQMYGGMGNAYANAAMAEASAPQGNMFGDLLGAAGTGIAAYAAFASDENLKEDVQPLEGEQMDELLEKLSGYKYNYKDDSGFDDGAQHAGIMAQDLEKSDMGAGMVHEDDAGNKMVKVDMSTILSMLAHLDSKIEGDNK